jgi:hypothetical protein
MIAQGGLAGGQAQVMIPAATGLAVCNSVLSSERELRPSIAS